MNSHLNSNNIAQRLSYWLDTAQHTLFQALDHTEKVDAVVIGGGICGVTTALLLQQQGIKTALLEANQIAHGASGYTTAKITSQHRLKYTSLLNKKGYEKTLQYAQAQQKAIQKIANLVKTYKINCDYSSQSSYVYAEQPQDLDVLEKEYHIAQQLHLPAEWIKEAPLPFKNYGALCFKNQAQFHPVQYIFALTKHLKAEGVRIFEHSPVFRIDIGQPHVVYTPKGSVRADHVIIASHYPILNKSGLYFARLEVMRSYIIAIKAPTFSQHGLFINAQGPVCSLRHAQQGSDLVLLGGEGHQTGHYKKLQAPYDYLQIMAQQRFQSSEPLYSWSAQDCLTLDDVPYIGRLSRYLKNIFVATGFSKWGMSGGTAAAMILKDMISGQKHQAEVFDPTRFDILSQSGKVIKNGYNFAKGIMSRFFYVPTEKLAQVDKGTGALIQYKSKKLGVYRDENDRFFAVIPYCSHMGCLLHWNQAELSWDCPCHASRYTYEGKVIESPAIQPLTQITIKMEEDYGDHV